jgi:putative ABC transport system substrate-binding protein
MKRREFITLLGGAAVAWPLGVRAQQQAGRMRRLGALMTTVPNDPQSQVRNAAFLQGLQELGWSVGRNIHLDYRWSSGAANDTRQHAAELVALAPDAIFAAGSASVGPLLQITRAVPIVFSIVPDPVGAGFVDSLYHPGGNATGFMTFEPGIGGKWLELLKELAPTLKRAAVIRDPAITAGIGQWSAIQALERIPCTSTSKPPATSIASSRAKGRANCQYRRRPSMRW